MRLAIPTVVFFLLACSGELSPPVEAPEPPGPAPEAAPEPEPEPEPDWVETAIDEALNMEEQPGTSGDRGDERRAALRAFFEAHPEYRAAEERQKLADLACAFGIESAHEKLANPEPKTAAVVEVGADGWSIVVAHADGHCTSDDWSWFTNEVSEAATAHGAAWAYADASNDALVIRRDGEEVQRLPLSGQGYLVMREGKEPVHIEHNMTDAVLAEVAAALDWR